MRKALTIHKYKYIHVLTFAYTYIHKDLSTNAHTQEMFGNQWHTTYNHETHASNSLIYIYFNDVWLSQP